MQRLGNSDGAETESFKFVTCEIDGTDSCAGESINCSSTANRYLQSTTLVAAIMIDTTPRALIFCDATKFQRVAIHEQIPKQVETFRATTFWHEHLNHHLARHLAS